MFDANETQAVKHMKAAHGELTSLLETRKDLWPKGHAYCVESAATITLRYRDGEASWTVQIPGRPPIDRTTQSANTLRDAVVAAITDHEAQLRNSDDKLAYANIPPPNVQG